MPTARFSRQTLQDRMDLFRTHGRVYREGNVIELRATTNGVTAIERRA